MHREPVGVLHLSQVAQAWPTSGAWRGHLQLCSCLTQHVPVCVSPAGGLRSVPPVGSVLYAGPHTATPAVLRANWYKQELSPHGTSSMF